MYKCIKNYMFRPRTNIHTSKFAQHLIEQNHPFGTIHNTMQIRHHKKAPHLNTLERFHIYAEYVTNNHINDNQTIFPNRLFDTLLKAHSREQEPPPTPAPKRSDTRLPQHNQSQSLKRIVIEINIPFDRQHMGTSAKIQTTQTVIR